MAAPQPLFLFGQHDVKHRCTIHRCSRAHTCLIHVHQDICIVSAANMQSVFSHTFWLISEHDCTTGMLLMPFPLPYLSRYTFLTCSQIRIRRVYRPLIVAPRVWQGQDGIERERLVFVGVGSWGVTSNSYFLVPLACHHL